ncbi:DNA-binding protein YbiB [Propionivibrio sp.]|uniref:DNA-binding protein YbiB n=1 Tax=Propionivibrio sp. TaxID=2212460 RepID=UPI0025F16956|nr:DNA-binding protein YbiB [Propionivibrio sp.]MBK7356644.1 DNA-binding protein YbiB [Propionivibrio sp.]MBK8401057.1 DNA-binding protein YbiB [Propionivibrio sp.]MBK8744225.1 DNA-binding protein YbiB [Propionivibrio sp.]MBK8894342.1 DNA-binding protein YbiB [Propionivibrio sp.]MBL0208854.1 DNA-binding protein YbiB [Propionivibrio sp.]
MNYAHFIREIARGSEGARDMSLEESQQLYGAVLDGGVADLELGAIAIALRVKGETVNEMLGFLTAANERLNSLRCPPGRIRPVVIPTYNGARKGVNLTPLLALLLRRFGIPVVLHGQIEGYGRVTTAQILREFGLMPSTSQIQAQQSLDENGLAYVPLAIVSPGLNNQLALRSRLGLRNSAHSLVKMLDPFKGGGLLLAAATHPDYLMTMREVLSASGTHALLLRGTEGEPYANPKRRPRIEHLHDGVTDILFEAEHESLKTLPLLPESCDAKSTAVWMRRVLSGEVALPTPVANQLACCLYASRYADDFNQAKAIVAVDGSVLNAA